MYTAANQVLAAQLVDATYVHQGGEALRRREAAVHSMLAQVRQRYAFLVAKVKDKQKTRGGCPQTDGLMPISKPSWLN